MKKIFLTLAIFSTNALAEYENFGDLDVDTIIAISEDKAVSESVQCGIFAGKMNLGKDKLHKFRYASLFAASLASDGNLNIFTPEKRLGIMVATYYQQGRVDMLEKIKNPMPTESYQQAYNSLNCESFLKM
ncbi:hypothetical protein AB6D33_21485 [Vibrio splendidus]